MKKGLSKGKRKVLESVIKYYRNNRSCMRYNEYLSKGFPVGSGNVESACKVLIKQRMESSGMRWTKGGGQNVIDIRSIYLNGDLDEFFKYYMESQREVLYGKKEGKMSECKSLKVVG